MAPSLVSCMWLVKIFHLPWSPFTRCQNGGEEFLPGRIVMKVKGDNAHKTFRTGLSIGKHSISVHC